MATKRVTEKNVVIPNTTSTAPARRKSVTKKRAAHTAAVEVSEVIPTGSVKEITHEEVAELAYSYWVARGGQGGSPEEDWLRAEKELSAYAPAK
jgi:hypothetical protein